MTFVEQASFTVGGSGSASALYDGGIDPMSVAASMSLQDWTPKWFQFPFQQLVGFRDTSMLDTGPLSGHGVYLFLRTPRVTSREMRTAEGFGAWLEAEFQRRQGSISAKFSRHFATGVIEVHLGLSNLFDPEQGAFTHRDWDTPQRRVVAQCLGSAPPPVLYCGETHHFATRVAQHLDGTEVWERLRAVGYSYDDVALKVFPFPTVKDPTAPEIVSFRRSVERLLAQLTLAPFTHRPG